MGKKLNIEKIKDANKIKAVLEKGYYLAMYLNIEGVNNVYLVENDKTPANRGIYISKY